MGDYGGFSAVLDITPQDPDEENQTQDFDYTLYVVGFFTTNEMIGKFVVFLIWLPISLYQVYIMCKKTKKVKED